MHPAGVSDVVPIGNMQGDDDTCLLNLQHQEARQYLRSHKWCFGIGEEYFGIGIGGIVAVFLMQLEPRATGVDEWLWIVAGDIPSAYLVLDELPNPTAALEAYIGLMRDWEVLAAQDKTSPDVFPVSAAPNPENALALRGRLDLIEEFYGFEHQT